MPKKTLGTMVADAYAVAVAARALAEATVRAKIPYRTVAQFVRAAIREVERAPARAPAIVDELDGLSLRSHHACQELGIHTIDDLAACRPTRLRTAGASVKTIRELQAQLAALGRTLAVRGPTDRMLLADPVRGGKRP